MTTDHRPAYLTGNLHIGNEQPVVTFTPADPCLPAGLVHVRLGHASLCGTPAEMGALGVDILVGMLACNVELDDDTRRQVFDLADLLVGQAQVPA